MVLTVLGAPAPAAPGLDRLALDKSAVVVEANQPAYVRHAAADLAAYLEEITGRTVPTGGTRGAGADVAILIAGPKMAEGVLEPEATDKLGAEGFVLKAVAKGGAWYIVAAGAKPAGTKYAVFRLMRAIRAEGDRAFVPLPLDIRSIPAFAKRGMHPNGWAFNYPYAFRGWSEEDWRRYVDVLSYQGVNLLLLWSFVEIMPVPLSEADRGHLEMFRRVTDYAQQKHGMEVWLMHCTNRIARDRAGQEDPRLRRYWNDSQVDVNPGDPNGLRQIMDSRSAMYRIIDNADGIGNIDSDPGYWRGSPLSDYMKAMRGFRALLDEHNAHGRKAALVNWLWLGWDGAKPRDTIQAIKRGLPEPWLLISGMFNQLPVCREEGVLGKTVFLPYNIVEGEPSYPMTNVDVGKICRAMGDLKTKYPELRGAMGNVQCPLLQFPNVYAFTSVIWDPNLARAPEPEVLLDLAGYLYPRQARLVAECLAGLKSADPAGQEALADRLEQVLREDKLGRPGVFGRKLFPDQKFFARTLPPQLRFRAANRRLATFAAKGADRAAAVKVLRGWCSAFLPWDTAHGWWKTWRGWRDLPGIAGRLAPCFADEADASAAFDEIDRALAGEHHDKAARQRCIDQLRRGVLAALKGGKPRATAPAGPAHKAALEPNLPVDLVVEAVVTAVSNPRPPARLSYANGFFVVKYRIGKVTAGRTKGDVLQAVHWSVRDRRTTPAAAIQIGQKHRLVLASWESASRYFDKFAFDDDFVDVRTPMYFVMKWSPAE